MKGVQRKGKKRKMITNHALMKNSKVIDGYFYTFFALIVYYKTFKVAKDNKKVRATIIYVKILFS